MFCIDKLIWCCVLFFCPFGAWNVFFFSAWITFVRSFGIQCIFISIQNSYLYEDGKCWELTSIEASLQNSVTHQPHPPHWQYHAVIRRMPACYHLTTAWQPRSFTIPFESHSYWQVWQWSFPIFKGFCVTHQIMRAHVVLIISPLTGKTKAKKN